MFILLAWENHLLGGLSSDEEAVLFVVDGLPTSEKGVGESVPKSPKEELLQPVLSRAAKSKRWGHRGGET